MRDRAVIGIDGNCGYALLGENLQEGESEFVEISECPHKDRHIRDQEAWAATRAFSRLKKRLGRQLTYYLHPSHPRHVG